METIYTGKEPNLVHTLIERTIQENKICPMNITTIAIKCYMPREKQLELWQIAITLNGNHTTYFYSKNCIKHGYSMTYLEHLYLMGVKKIKLKDLVKE